MKTILSVASARPNFVKLAAIHQALAAHPDQFRHIIVHTGQHYDPLLSDIFFEQLSIPQPNYNLGVKGGAEREEVIALTEAAIAPVLQNVHPDVVLVYGDVNGAVGAARAAKQAGIPIGHVEAGLRSFDASMPEELNRIEIDHLADLLFVSEQSGIDHLQKEGVQGAVHFVGNTMIDTLIRMMPAIAEHPVPLPQEAFAIATIHRPSNVDDPAVLRQVLSFLSDVGAACPILLPAHPRLRQALEGIAFPLESASIQIIEPMAYLAFLHAMQHAAFILTDSGGIQEEAVLLQKCCFTLRRNTERPSTIESGSNVLIDPSLPSDRAVVLSYAENPLPPIIAIPPLWDGAAGGRIAAILEEFL